MLVSHVALVPEYAGIDLRALMRVAAAIQKQITRDVAPVWGVHATVDAFERLEDVPLGYWPVILTLRDLAGQDGTHLDHQGGPYALVELDGQWSLTASHECIEMIVDPHGNRLVAGDSPRSDHRRVEYLVEPCDPCQGAATAYLVNDVLVSDFVTPAFFEPVTSQQRYSYSGKVAAPHSVLAGGYLSWRDHENHWWQRSSRDGQTLVDEDIGTLAREGAPDKRSLRETVNTATQHHRHLGRVTQAIAADVHQSLAGAAKASRARARAVRSHARGLPRSQPAPTTRTDVGAEIDRALALLKAKGDLPDKQAVLETLSRAREQLAMSKLEEPSARPEHRDLALVMSAIHSPLVAPRRSLLFGRDVLGFSQYADGDVRWAATVWNDLFSSVMPFSVAPSPGVVTHPLQRTCTIAMAGDWGTGDASSKAIGQLIENMNPTYSIHLGDVYYSGTEGEETDNFVNLWPSGVIASYTLNSNHEMYSGGHGYFNVALKDEKFETQGAYSYFALVNDDWVILGLDSAYTATSFYQDGAINQPQLDWIAQLVSSKTFDGPNGPKKVMALSHHQGMEIDGPQTRNSLWKAVTGALGARLDYWYWGHVHGVAVFKPVDGVNARLLGHGGVPYLSDGDKNNALIWTEPKGQDLIQSPGPTRSRNGFAVLSFDGPNLTERFYDELGNCRWSSP